MEQIHNSLDQTGAAAEDMTYEQAYQELEQILASLESGNLSLEDNLRLFERGQALIRRCTDLLDNAELRVQQIMDGQLKPVNLLE